MTRVLIIEDHISMVESIKSVLEESGRYTVVGHCATAALTQVMYLRLHPDLVFMDICTEGGVSGLTAAEQLLCQYPHCRVILMSGFDEVSYAPRAKEIGAHAFLYKSRSLQTFLETADLVMQGERCFPEQSGIPVLQGESGLSARELEVLRLRCKPMSNTEIAEVLHISPRTVKFHLDNIKAKTGFTEMMDLLLWVLSNGWINPNY